MAGKNSLLPGHLAHLPEFTLLAIDHQPAAYGLLIVVSLQLSTQQ
jgi:hypothetical protein